jgi:toxin-antitoxin system PIN domain toxin
MITYLLDINLLLALSDSMHIHHDIAHQWFAQTGRLSWATCPITENGFVRIASHPKYPNRPGDAGAVLAILRVFCASEGHRFWSAEVSLRELVGPRVAMTPQQITDIYLLGLAVHRQGKLATLDRHIPASVIQGGSQALEILPIGSVQ